MSSLSLDRTLALLIAALAATGLLSLRAGAPDEAFLFVLHGLLGGSLLAAVLLKLRRSVPRAIRHGRRQRLAYALLVAALTLAAIGAGFAWVASGSIIVVGPWTLISWHAAIGLALVPLVVVHLLPRRWRVLRPVGTRPGGPRIPRRSFLVGGSLGLVALTLWAGANLLDGARGGLRRFTGSRWLPPDGIPPETTFLGEGTPTIDPSAWRLTIHGRVERPRSYDLAGLAALGEHPERAVLDCTSGWAMETTWRGVPLGAVLDAAGVATGASRVDVRAVTGWGAGLALADARRSLLATHVAGAPLPPDNGAPCRLVVPDRRGLDWVKWVTEIEVS